MCWLGANQGNFRIVNFLTWCRNPLGNSLSLINQIGKRCIRHYPTRAGATLLPNRLLTTTPPIGRLAYWPATLLPDQPRPSDDDATFARNWNPPSEKNSSSQPKNSSSRPDLKRIGSRTPPVVRFGKRRTTPLLSPPAHLANLPQLPATASNPSLDSSSPHPPQGRWIRPASTRTFFRDSDTPVLKHNESTSTKLTTQQRYVSPPPTQVIHLSSENHVQHPSTCTDSETTNRGYYAVDQAASSTKAATVKQHTVLATSSTKSTSSPSKPLSCEHTEQWPTNPMTVLLYAHAQPNLPSTNSSSVTNHQAQPVASPTPISTTSVTMTTPSEAQAPSPFYNSRPTRSSSSQATTQLTHGLPAQNSTTMDRNNNAVCDTLQATGHEPRPRLIFGTRD